MLNRRMLTSVGSHDLDCNTREEQAHAEQLKELAALRALFEA
ncbi:MAG: hypothetical protein R3F28_07005 [Candidatus Kapaibacterium sp.]